MILAWLIVKGPGKQFEPDQTNIVNSIIMKMGDFQMSSLSRLLEAIQEGSTKQINEIKDNQIKLEQRFSLLQTATQESLNTGLSNIQNSVQERLQQALLGISEMNRTELGKLQEMTNKNFELLSKTNQDKLEQINQDVQKRLNDNFLQHLKSFEDVTRNLGEMKVAAQTMIDSTTSIDKLNSIFSRTNSKAIGDFGEKYLESILAENLNPNSWEKQVVIPGTNDKIDFVIKIDGKKIGIDCKLPATKYNDYLEADKDNKKAALKAFLRSILEMAEDISKKYQKDSYLEHLLMYLPSDSMYSEVANDEATVTALQKLKVAPVSPITIFPLVLIIRTYQFKYNINQNAEQIIAGLSKIKENVKVFQDEFRKLGDKIRQAQQNYDLANRSLITVSNTMDTLESGKEEKAVLLEEDKLI